MKASHTWGSWIVDTEAKCETAGARHHVCVNCGKKESETVKALGHLVNGQVRRVAPTCLVDGYQVVVCSRCGATQGEKTILKATGHSWGKWVIDVDAGCETSGTKHRNCTKCNERENGTIDPKGHLVEGQVKREAPTCTKDGYQVVVCSRCGKEQGGKTTLKATGHSWGKWEIDVDAGCETTGTKHRFCTKCNARDNGTIDAKGHRFDGQLKTVPATCTKDGYTAVICSNCGKEAEGRTTLPALGHDWGAWNFNHDETCEKDGTKYRFCKRCGEREDGTVPHKVHTVSSQPKVVAATCVKDGYRVMVCSNCGKDMSERTILPKTGIHSFGVWVTSKDAGCEEVGEKYRKCVNCTEKEYDTIKELGHLVLGQRHTYIPEAGGEGYTVVVCSRCGKEMANRLVFDVPVPEVTVEFHLSDKHGEAIIDPLVVVCLYKQKMGKVFPKVINPKQYTITAWRDSKGKQYDENTILNSTQKLDLYPVWGNASEYSIFFVGNGASTDEIKCYTVEYGKEFTLPKAKELFDDGKGFEKWGTTPDGGTRVFADGETRTNFAGQEPSITLYALWNESRNVVYWDSIRNQRIGGDTLTHVYKVKGEKDYPSIKINGLVLDGWTRKDNKDFYQPGSKQIADGKDWVLKPIYSVAEEGKIAIVFYNPSGNGKDVEVRTYWPSNSTVTLSNVFPLTDTLHYLDKWISREDGMEFKANQTIDIYTLSQHGGYMVLEAVWGRYPEELRLYYGYDNKVDVIIVDVDNYELPVPERKGYTFVGWSEEQDNRAKILSSSCYNVPKYGGKLYAIWDKTQYSIEYYDGITGDPIGMAKTVTVTDMIGADYAYVPGMRFSGWVPERLIPYDAAAARKLDARTETNKIFNQGAFVSDLPLKTRTIKLYSLYVQESYTEGQTVVYFHSSKGSGIIDPKPYTESKLLVLPDCKMEVKGCTFLGWELLGGDGTIYPAYASYYVEVSKKKSGSVVFVARWKNNFKITLDPNYPGATKVDLADRYAVGDYIMTADLNTYTRKGYTLVGWEAAQKNFCKPYGMADQIFVPNQDLTLIAIWRKNTYKVYYHSGFNEYVGVYSDESYEKTNLTFDESKLYWVEVPGYEFIGWTLKNPNGKPCEVPASEIITPQNNPERVLVEDLHVYSCYKEAPLDVNDEKVLVSYNLMGGTDGPKDEYFNPKKGTYHISSVVPKRDGYTFEGWKTYDIIVDDGNYSQYIVDNVLALYASWTPTVRNVMKDAFQREYGKDKMPDFYFLTEYESPEWEKIDNYCYFAIKTTPFNTADHGKEMDSIVLVVKYNNGKWELTGRSASTNWREQLEYDILTRNNDTAGRVIKLATDVGISALEEHPVFKYFVKSMDIGSLCAKAEKELKKDEVSMDVVDKIQSKILQNLYKIFYSELHDTTLASDMVMKVEPSVRKSIIGSIKDNKSIAINTVSALHTLCSTVVKYGDDMVFDLETILRHADTELGVKIDEKIVNVLCMECEEFRTGKLKDIDSMLGKVGTGINAVSFILTEVFDNIGYQKSIDKAMDPFGEMNLALKTFYDQIGQLEFSSDIKNGFPTVIEKIYNAYCKLK